MVLLSSRFQFIKHQIAWSYNPSIAVTTLVWAIPRSLATTSGITFVFFSSGYLDVSVLRVRSPYGVTCLQHARLPHSEICGSQCMCHYPQLIAAYHVLLRLSEPRHSLCALSNLSNLLVFFLYLFTTSINSNMSMNFLRGGYRSRTDDPLRARQVLQPAELIPQYT